MMRLIVSLATFITVAMAWSGILTSAICFWGKFAAFHWVMLAITIFSTTGANYYILLGGMPTRGRKDSI